MGRRSINTTKSGKYMNPTDQARKEARKKELKKNKKQRQMVRAAVLKMKDPNQILEELEKIDEMEFNVLQPSPLNEKVLKEKRKKLKETFDRVMKMYDKDDPEKWIELKRQEMDYEKRRAHLISYYESVKHAQSVQVDDIPLPTLQVPDNMLFGTIPSQIPLPADNVAPSAPVKPILKKDSAYRERPAGVEPPGVPPGPPPDYAQILADSTKPERLHKEKKSLRFSDIADEASSNDIAQPPVPGNQEPEDLDGEAMDDSEIAETPNALMKPTLLQQRMLALSGQNIDEFMKEMEEVHRKRTKDKSLSVNERLVALARGDERADSESDSDAEMDPPPRAEHAQAEMRLIPPPMMPPGVPPPPPPRGPFGLPMAGVPPPPPGMPRAPPGVPIRARPPGPPPGAPPRPPLHASVLSAAPQLLHRKEPAQGATISAKPQIRNLSADVTRFVPSALRVKREDKHKKAAPRPAPRPALPGAPPPTKDDAYTQFMKEMEGLL